MRIVIRFVTAACILLSVGTLSMAQKKEPTPLDRVITELQAGNTEKALAVLDDVVKQDPKNPDAYLLRGTLTMQEKPAQALSDFDKVIELKPDSGVAYNQRAFMRLAINNDRTGALKDLDAAIAHNFKDDSVYSLRCQIRWQLGDLTGALSDLDEAVKLNPNNARFYANRGELLMALKETDRALADFNYLINWYETNPSARPAPTPSTGNEGKSGPQPNTTAKDDSKTVRIEVAQQTANEAPGSNEMAPTIANVYTNRGWIVSQRGNHVAAFADFEKAIRIDPTNVWALYDRAVEYEYKGDLPAALADITKALQLEPKNGNFVVEHGVLLLLMGRDKEAQADFDMLLQSDKALWQKRIDERTAAVRKVLPNK